MYLEDAPIVLSKRKQTNQILME